MNIRKINRHLILAFILLLFIPVWIIWISPHFKKIPNNFSYNADILSRDNLYNDKFGKFQGEQISKTHFNYEIIQRKNKEIIIENSFNVRTLNDKPIFSVTRLYTINPYTWQHILNSKDNRSGFLFGPRNANKDDFTYWHVNYDAPAVMHFDNEEKIDGLTVYHYKTQYEADQTDDLSYLQDVPEKKGIRTDVNLQLWIEPVSGWLVKYQDNTLAYFYDKKTGKSLSPWNKFTNTYTVNSVHQQVKNAYYWKWKILFINFGVPLLIILFAMSIICLPYKKQILVPTKKIYQPIITGVQTFRGSALIIISLIIILFASQVILYLYAKFSDSRIATIGISLWNNNKEEKEIIKAFKESLAEANYIEGRNVKYIEKTSNQVIEDQINIIQSFIEKNVDLIFTLNSPSTLIAKGITNTTPVVFANINYPVELEIIDSLDVSNNNFVGVTNYVSPPYQLYFFEKMFPNLKKLGFVHHMGDPNSELQLTKFKTMLSKRNVAIIDISAIDSEDLKLQLKDNLSTMSAIYLSCDAFSQGEGGEIVLEIANANHIPTFSCGQENISRGSLMSYGYSPNAIGNLAGQKAALILRGAEPSWLHTESPPNAELTINTNASNNLGIVIPTFQGPEALYVIKY